MARVKSITQTVTIPAPPAAVYTALTRAKIHAAFTHAAATGVGRVGGKFTAWDGYICGVHRELVPGERIVQDWWTTAWPEGAEPSRLEITLAPAKGGTRLRMVHSNVPAEQADGYRQGWIDFYWTPLTAFFSDSQEG